ncbi:MAG: glutaredoxin family protein [Patescibacteria group bacterium]
MSEGKKVIVYSTPTCGYCKMAKTYFEKNGVEYEEKDVSSDIEARQEMIKKSGQMGVPVILIGDEFVIGFNQGRLAKLLDIK